MTAPNRPPFAPEIEQALSRRADLTVSLRPDEIPQLRSRAATANEEDFTRDGEFHLSRHRARDPRTGASPDVVLLRPRDRPEPVPVLYHVHGGGLVAGTAFDDLAMATELASGVGMAVASVEYRLAPEHRYPAAVEDVYAGLRWVAANAPGLGLDPKRIVISGVSAGGGLAAAAALLARDLAGPNLMGQILVCPMLDDRNDSDSSRQMAGVGVWDRTANETGWSAYLGAQPRSEAPVYASPARATDLSGLPPTYVDAGSAETFRDEDVEFARRIWAAGGAAELHIWQGGAHAFDAWMPEAALSRQARRTRAEWLHRLLVEHLLAEAARSGSTT
ncbi:alpha/beta hydrolase [Glycomyces harbinensis]|uniref:Acetyl esterase/lipase n=1 Tax=Glycomyces harbinensis TaxID=58114 RepID=A0A1G6WY53_9ACTN|nr:alpha/beta hydrolase [Glycomyces harbinensis]SDD69935.1 Acetyl esterase/lipase [Glycomyces harbinensis]